MFSPTDSLTDKVGYSLLSLNFGAWILKKRTEVGLGQQELANAAGISKTQVWRIESGKQGTKPETAKLLLKALGATQEESQKALLLLVEVEDEIVAEDDADASYVAASYSGMTKANKEIIMSMVKALRTAERRRGLGGKDDVDDEGDGDDDGDIDEADK